MSVNALLFVPVIAHLFVPVNAHLFLLVNVLLFVPVNTVKSRHNGFQGTGENHPLLPKSVIAKMIMADYFQSHKTRKVVLLYFLCSLSYMTTDCNLLFKQNIENYSFTAYINAMAIISKDSDWILLLTQSVKRYLADFIPSVFSERS